MGPSDRNAILQKLQQNKLENSSRPLVISILAEFSSHGIRYCYWKSTAKLGAAISGFSDIDLLIARSDQHRAQQILLAWNCKLFLSVGDIEPPSILNYIGHDETSGRLVHFHLHFQLLVGGPLSPPWHLPWETTLLSRAVPDPGTGIMCLDPACEALLLLVRCCLEVRGADPASIRRKAAKMAEFERDRLDLLPRICDSDLQALVADLLSPRLAGLMIETFRAGTPDGWYGRLGREIRRHLPSRSRGYSGTESFLRTWSGTAAWIVAHLSARVLKYPGARKRRPAGGGILIAVVGVDGSGKSSLVAALRDWLGHKADVLPVYFGTGDGRPSVVLRPFRWLMPIARALLGKRPSVASHGRVSGGPPSRTYSLLLTVWAAAVAADKRIKLTAVRRAIARGFVVVTDRYPQNETSAFNDGPLLVRIASAPEWLRKQEKTVYESARQQPPNLILRLVAEPETLASREPAMELQAIVRRLAALSRITFGDAPTVIINAELPFEEVVAHAKRAVWQLL